MTTTKSAANGMTLVKYLQRGDHFTFFSNEIVYTFVDRKHKQGTNLYRVTAEVAGRFVYLTLRSTDVIVLSEKVGA